MELWTQAHIKTLLPTLAVMVLLSLLLRKWLLPKPQKVRMIPLQILAVMILLLEAGKQIVSFSRGYDLYHIPLHYCSLFIFMLPLMAFYKGKHESDVRGVGAGLCGAVTMLMLIYPNLIYGSWNIEGYFQDFLNFHTVTYHSGVVFAFLLTLALQLHTPKAEKSRGLWCWLWRFSALSPLWRRSFYRSIMPIFISATYHPWRLCGCSCKVRWAMFPPRYCMC